MELGQCNWYSDQATGWTTEESWFNSQEGQGIFSFPNTSKLALRSAQPPTW